jgi:hypothetical protein
MQKLTGTWRGDGDGMTYHFTQIENDLYMYGNNSSCHNVGFGTIDEDSATVILQWADTPDSAGFGHHGICYLDASQEGTITKKAGDAHYAIGNFTRVEGE